MIGSETSVVRLAGYCCLCPSVCDLPMMFTRFASWFSSKMSNPLRASHAHLWYLWVTRGNKNSPNSPPGHSDPSTSAAKTCALSKPACASAWRIGGGPQTSHKISTLVLVPLPRIDQWINQSLRTTLTKLLLQQLTWQSRLRDTKVWSWMQSLPICLQKHVKYWTNGTLVLHNVQQRELVVTTIHFLTHMN